MREKIESLPTPLIYDHGTGLSAQEQRGSSAGRNWKTAWPP
jgi:hypothetical protein